MGRHGISGFGRAALKIASWTLLSRILGLVRDRLMFGLLGRSAEAGAFYLAWTIPNTFRRLLGDGALSAAFVPVLTSRLEQDGIEGARRSYAAVFGALLLVLAALLVFLECAVGLASASFLSFGEGPAYGELVRSLTLVLLPYLVPVCLMSLAAGAQHVRGGFALPALAPAALNLVWIVAALLAVQRGGSLREQVLFVAWCVLGGGALQFALQLPGLARSGFLVGPRLDRRDRDLRAVVAAMMPMLLGLSVLQFNTLISQFLAVYLVDKAAPAIVFLGHRLLEFPHALLGVAMGTAVFPLLSLLGSRGEHEELERAVSKALGLGLFLAMPAAAGLFALAPWLVEVLFRTGRFDAEAAAEATRVTRVLCLALPGLIAVQVLARTHYALGDMKTPLKIAALLLVFGQSCNFVFAPRFGTTGLAMSSALAASCNAALLAYSLQRNVGTRLRGSMGTLVRASLASVPSAWAAYGAAHAMEDVAATSLAMRIVTLLLVPGSVGVLVFFAAASLVGGREMASLRESLRERRKRKRGEADS